MHLSICVLQFVIMQRPALVGEATAQFGGLSNCKARTSAASVASLLTCWAATKLAVAMASTKLRTFPLTGDIAPFTLSGTPIATGGQKRPPRFMPRLHMPPYPMPHPSAPRSLACPNCRNRIHIVLTNVGIWDSTIWDGHKPKPLPSRPPSPGAALPDPPRGLAAHEGPAWDKASAAPAWPRGCRSISV